MNLKFGIISDIDAQNCLAKVYFEEDELVSNWLQMSVIRAGADQFSFPFDVNEHVWCIMDEYCEYGVIGGAVYDDNNKPSSSKAGSLRFKFADNSTIEYDKTSRKLTLDIKGDITIKSTGLVTVQGETVNIKGTNVNVDGILNVTGAANIQGIAALGGLASITPGTPLSGSSTDLNVKSVAATGDVTVGAISLKTHKHTAPGTAGSTSTPIP